MPYQKNRTNRFSRVRHVNRTFVSNHFCHEWQCSAMVQVKVRKNNTIQVFVQTHVIRDKREVWKFPLKLTFKKSTMKIRAQTHSVLVAIEAFFLPHR